MRLKDKVCFLTGATGGIGEVMARRFAAEGAKLVLASRNAAKGEPIAQAIRDAGGEAVFVPMDTAIEDQVKAAVEACADLHGRIDVLVNNAGPVDLILGGVDKRLDLMSTDDFDWMVKVSLYGPFWCLRYVLPHMVEQKSGSIINISSIAAVSGLPNMPGYAAGKGGLSALTRQVAFDFGKLGIRSNAIVVGTVVHDTSRVMVDTPEKHADVLSRTLTDRLGDADDVASAAIYLASDESGFVTGVNFPLEGGLLVKSR